MMRKKWCMSGLVLLITALAATAEKNTSPVDSTLLKDKIKIELYRRTRTGLALSAGGSVVAATGLLLPFVGDSKKNPGALLLGSVGMTLSGSTAAAIGTSIIYRWGRDHVKYLPSTGTWRTYKVGVAAMFSGLILTATGVEFGALVFMGGEVMLTVSSIQSLLYCNKVRREYNNNRFEYFVMPTVKNKDSYGLTMQMTF